jgi:Ser/Thr protein kinase RdoA (MazF antagonist)
MNLPPDSFIAIADRFSHPGQVTDLKPFGNGNINDTFLVTVDVPVDHQFVLQRINTQVFSHPQWVMENMRLVTEHIHQALQREPIDRRWETPRVLLTRDGLDHFEDESGSFWRAISFIDESAALDQIQDVDHAQEVGFALGTFHRLIQGIPAANLKDTLEGFHITPRYLAHYQTVLATSQVVRSVPLNRCLRWVRDRMSICDVLEQAKRRGELPLRIMHGDPKVNNVMIDIATQKAISMVDLDTVKPGLIHYDIGDCLRSGCNPLGEEVEDARLVKFNLDLCAGILQGYLEQMRSVLLDADYDYIFDAVRVITFELGLRFLTDHLAGNVYFKVKDSDHNLRRASVQFRLMESLEAQEVEVRAIVDRFR